MSTIVSGPEAARQGTRRARWTVRVPADFDLVGLAPPHLKMLLVLEGLCRDRSYCWASNATLGTRYDCSARQAQSILKGMEAAEILWRLPINPEKPTDGRAGIFLHRRLDPDRPVEDRPPPPEAVRRLWEARKMAGEPAARYEGNFVPPTKETSYPPTKETSYRIRDEGENKDETDDDEGASSSSLSPREGGGEKTPDSLAPLVAEAENRFGANMAGRVVEAVAVYTRPWVDAAVWGCPNLREWGGVIRTLERWKDECGPSGKAVELARRNMGAAGGGSARLFIDDVRAAGFRLALVDGQRVGLYGPNVPTSVHVNPEIERRRADFLSRLKGLGADVLRILTAEASASAH